MIKKVLFCAALIAVSAGSAMAQELRTALIPQDVVARVMSLEPATAAGFCSRPSALRGYLGQQPPVRVRGYNSRMDNVASVEGARTLERMASDFSQAAAYGFVSRDSGAKTEMLDFLTHLARTGAFTDTESCVRGGQLLPSCTEWTRDDGTDLSAMKDFTAVQMAVSSMQRGYYLAAADFQTAERAADHQTIQNWFNVFNARMKRPTDVYFGLQMGWHWPSVDAAAAQRGAASARSAATSLGRGLDRLVLSDGSLRDRTTRGDRALWYHNSALNEIVHSMEMMRATGARIPASLEQKLHVAVNLFIRSVNDHSVIDPWASQAQNARYTPNRQDWPRDWQNSSSGGSWWHIYAYRYPDRPEGQWLRASVRPNAGSARADQEIGVAVGCIYNAANAAR